MIRPLCPKCRKKITGRASDMENFLKVITLLIEACESQVVTVEIFDQGGEET